MQTEIQTVL